MPRPSDAPSERWLAGVLREWWDRSGRESFIRMGGKAAATVATTFGLPFAKKALRQGVEMERARCVGVLRALAAAAADPRNERSEASLLAQIAFRLDDNYDQFLVPPGPDLTQTEFEQRSDIVGWLKGKRGL